MSHFRARPIPTEPILFGRKIGSPVESDIRPRRRVAFESQRDSAPKAQELGGLTYPGNQGQKAFSTPKVLRQSSAIWAQPRWEKGKRRCTADCNGKNHWRSNALPGQRNAETRCVSMARVGYRCADTCVSSAVAEGQPWAGGRNPVGIKSNVAAWRIAILCVKLPGGRNLLHVEHGPKRPLALGEGKGKQFAFASVEDEVERERDEDNGLHCAN